MFSCFAAGCLICAEMQKENSHIGRAASHDGYAFGGNLAMRIRCWMRRLAALQSGFHSRFQIFWYMCRKRCQKGEEANLGVIFEKQLEMDLKGTALKESDLASLRTLGGQLGYLDVAMQ